MIASNRSKPRPPIVTTKQAQRDAKLLAECSAKTPGMCKDIFDTEKRLRNAIILNIRG